MAESPSFMPPSGSDSTAQDSTASDGAPVSAWLRQLEAGDEPAAHAVYQHFCSQVQELARRRLPDSVRRGYDEDDVAASAFRSLFLMVRDQKFPWQDRDDFWRMLLTVAERKIARRIRHELRGKRDIRRVIDHSVFQQPPSGMSLNIRMVADPLASREPTQEFAAEVAETCDALLAALPDDISRRILLLKLESHTVEEIARHLGLTQRTVFRKLKVIRCTWWEMSESDNFENSENDMSGFPQERASII